MFPADFQTVRDADTAGLISSDTEETTSLRAASHDGPTPRRTVDEDQTYHQEPACETSPCPPQSYQYRVEPRPSSQSDNPGLFQIPGETGDTPMSGVDTMEERVGKYSYLAENGNMMHVREEPRYHPSTHQNPTSNHTGHVATDANRPARVANNFELRESHVHDGAIRGSRTMLNRSDMSTINLQRAHQLHGAPGLAILSGSTGNAHVNLPSSSLNSEHGKNRLHDERTPQQLPSSRGYTQTIHETERPTHGNNVEHHQRDFSFTGPTLDCSPQKFREPVRSVHGVSPSPNRRPSHQLLRPLPRAPVRGSSTRKY